MMTLRVEHLHIILYGFCSKCFSGIHLEIPHLLLLQNQIKRMADAATKRAMADIPPAMGPDGSEVVISEV